MSAWQSEAESNLCGIASSEPILSEAASVIMSSSKTSSMLISPLSWRGGAATLGINCNVPNSTLTFSSVPGLHTAIVAHSHEWRAGVAIPICRRHRINVATVFTTHATPLGRYLCVGLSRLLQQSSILRCRSRSGGSVVSTTDIASILLLPTAPMSLPPSPTSPPMRQNRIDGMATQATHRTRL